MKKIKLITSLSPISVLSGSVAFAASGCTWSYKPEIIVSDTITIIAGANCTWDKETKTLTQTDPHALTTATLVVEGMMGVSFTLKHNIEGISIEGDHANTLSITDEYAASSQEGDEITITASSGQTITIIIKTPEEPPVEKETISATFKGHPLDYGSKINLETGDSVFLEVKNYTATGTMKWMCIDDVDPNWSYNKVEPYSTDPYKATWSFDYDNLRRYDILAFVIFAMDDSKVVSIFKFYGVFDNAQTEIYNFDRTPSNESDWTITDIHDIYNWTPTVDNSDVNYAIPDGRKFDSAYVLYFDFATGSNSAVSFDSYDVAWLKGFYRAWESEEYENQVLLMNDSPSNIKTGLIFIDAHFDNEQSNEETASVDYFQDMFFLTKAYYTNNSFKI